MLTTAVLFDFNGVVVDDEKIQAAAFRLALGEVGIKLDEDRYRKRYMGRDDCAVIASVLHDDYLPLDPEQTAAVLRRKTDLYLAGIQHGLKLCAGVGDLIGDLLSNDGVVLALAATARRHEVEMVLEQHNMSGSFGVVLTADEIKASKPDPSVFVSTLQELHEKTGDPFETTQCVVIEDSPAGVDAACRAGIPCIAVSHSCSKERLSDASLIVDSIQELDADKVLALVQSSGSANTSA